ncbi:molybdopterin-containing oxidoreductase family protein [Sulfurospirillum diekertiae]|uniref:Polysulfide reductase / sulfide dehydrogenase, chain A n=1 Tax=Sulfurospirillum diekertiae TaxID=1854492 RepID=A0A1Y0HSI3_9BACT|nr:molybdopterin-dependent oxidoreductase [Sulfurospirillum diekertiae]ARU50113.1 putative polysulfide reductase / sulfide dehydrogenase, chain A [Sulfurospirillum diekertiae]ASC94900.1 putative polysulfide reductase / sulfide dehydrogenase, chain A [Sulfurospirillum diekertiae]
MKVEISRRRFLQGSVAMSIAGGVSLSSSSIMASATSPAKKVGNEDKRVATLCEMCVNKCAAIAHVHNGVVEKLDPNPLFPKSRNMLCARGNSGIQALYDPDRLKYPLIRDGEKGSGKFKRVSWDEAYAYINEKLTKILDEEKDNRSTVAFCAGEGMAEHTFKSFFTMFGSSHFLNHASLCLATTVSGYSLTIGGYGQADLDNAKYVIMAGANRAEAIVTPDTMDFFKRTKGRGAKLVTVDPRFTNTAAKSDKWLAINVGTDLAFVLALTYVAIKEEIYNKAFVENYFNGFDAYKEHILSNNYTPEWAEKITGIKAADIYQVARDFMVNAPQSIYYQGRRTTWSKNDFQLRRAQAIFSALGGGVDIKGGICFGKSLALVEHEIPSPMYAQAKPRIEKDEAAVVGGSGSWVAFRNMVLEKRSPYPIRALFNYKHNPMQNMPNNAKTAEFLKNLDLVVTIDTMPSDTVMLSDVILPECTYLERTDPVVSFGGIEPSIAQRNKVVDPMFESKPIMEIMRGLSAKLSKPLFEITKKYDEDVQSSIEDDGEDKVYGDFDLTKPFASSQEELNEHAVAKYEGAAEILKEKGVFYPNMNEYFKKTGVNDYEYYPDAKRAYSVRNTKFATPSGKVECSVPALAKKGIDAMPVWKKEYEMAVPAGKFRFITGRHAQFTQSGTSNNRMLLNLVPENFAWINKRTAEKMGIKFGDKIEVVSKVGKTTIKAYPTEKIGPDTLFFIHGFGNYSEALTRAYHNGGNDAAIIEDSMEPMHGASCLHDTIVEIRKV